MSTTVMRLVRWSLGLELQAVGDAHHGGLFNPTDLVGIGVLEA